MNGFNRFLSTMSERISVPVEKRAGFNLLLLSFLIGAVAQITIRLSATDFSTYWDLSSWPSSIGNNASPALGLGLFILACLLFLLSLDFLICPVISSTFSVSTSLPPRFTPRFGFWATSLGLAALSFFHNFNFTSPSYNNTLEVSLWLLSIFLFSYSVLHNYEFTLPRLAAFKIWVIANKYEVFTLAFLTTGAFLMRFIGLEAHPFAFSNDEGEMGKMGLCLLNGTCRMLFSTGWATQPVLTFIPTAISISLLGNTAVAVRLVSVLIGTLAIFFTYLFARETFGKQTAWIAAVLAVTFPFHLHFSRQGFDNIIDSLSSTFLMWLIFRGARKGSPVYFLAAGIVAGLCFYTYPGSRLAPAIILGALAWIALRVRGFLRAQWRNLLILLLASLITAAPIAGFFAAAPGIFMSRITQESVFSDSWLVENISASSNIVELAARQLLKSSLVFIATDGPLQFFNTPRSYFSLSAAVLFVFGLAILARRLGDVRNMALFGWFWAPVIFGSALTVGAPSNQRMLGSSMPAVIIAAIGLVAVFNAFKAVNPFFRRLAPYLILLILLFNGVADLQFYFDEYRNGHYVEDLSNEITYESRRYIAPLGESGRLFFIGSPMTYTIFGNFAYFSPDVEKHDFNDVTRQSLAVLLNDKDALFMSIPQREADLANIAEWIPGGTWSMEYRRNFSEEPLFFAYRVTKEQLQGFQP